MTAQPNDIDALLDRLRRNAQAPMDRFDRLDGMGGFPEYGEDERPFPDEVLKLLDLLAAAEHRATRAEAQAAIRGRAVVVYRERAREAEARVRDLAQEVKDERGACLDQMEQVRIRDARIDAWEKQYAQDTDYWIDAAETAEARIKAVRDLCDDADKHHASVLIVTKVRRALDT